MTFEYFFFFFFCNRFDWISYRLPILHLCLCVALGSGGSQLSLDVISDIVTGPPELYYSWDQCQNLTRPDTGEPVPWRFFPQLLWPSITTALTRLSSLSRFFFLLRLSCETREHEKWECSPQGTSSERHWEGDTQRRLVYNYTVGATPSCFHVW